MSNAIKTETDADLQRRVDRIRAAHEKFISGRRIARPKKPATKPAELFSQLPPSDR